MTDHQEWLEQVDEHMVKRGSGNGSIILFPDYRPDLCMALSNYLKLEFYDYRKEEMLDKGWEASLITLDQLTDSLQARAAQGGIVAQNVEAMLATRTESERREWFNSFLNKDWPNTVIVPSAVFQAEVPHEHKNICDLELLELPKQSFLIRLAT